VLELQEVTAAMQNLAVRTGEAGKREAFQLLNGPLNMEARGKKANQQKGQSMRRAIAQGSSGSVPQYRQDGISFQQACRLHEAAKTPGAKNIFMAAAAVASYRQMEYAEQRKWGHHKKTQGGK
jgi:hypothetical protein